jgi:hypothetical protein
MGAPAKRWDLPEPPGAPEAASEKSLWDRYLRRLGEPEGPLSTERAKQVRALWDLLERRLGPSLKPPAAGALENGGFAMSWDNGRHHFEIEVTPDGTFDWFYMDRSSDTRAGEEDQPLGAVSPGLISQLRRILAA